MKLLPFILIIISTSLFSQDIVSDTIEDEMLKGLNLLNKSFDEFKSNPDLELLETKYQPIKSIGDCLSLLFLMDLSETEANLVYDRLREISLLLTNLNSPLIIIGNGMGSWARTRQLIQTAQVNNITYASLGNSCIGSELQNQGIEEFNKTTKKALGIDYLPFEKNDNAGAVKNKKTLPNKPSKKSGRKSVN